MRRVLVVGQTPPPFGGQAVMIQALLGGCYGSATLSHVRMAFSREMDDVGKWRPGKLLHLARVILSIIGRRLMGKCDILYYPPAGPNRVPFFRDVGILCATRWMFDKVIFHFQAAGIEDLYARLTRPEKALFRWAYRSPDLVVRPAPLADDGRLIHGARDFIVPNGVPDEAAGCNLSREDGAMRRLLFVGVLRESKGVVTAVEALALLVKKGVRCHLELMGKLVASSFEDQLKSIIRQRGIEENVTFLGIQTGFEFRETYLRNGIFCFPTHFESEFFPIVLLEAMKFAMPIVATSWRGIPAMVEEGRTGFLVPIRDSQALADRLEHLMSNPGEARCMGQRGRERYLKEYTLEHFRDRMDVVFRSLGEAGEHS